MAVRAAFLDAVGVVPAVIEAASPRWEESSALEGWTIGGLTGHFARGVGQVARYLDQPTPPRGPEMDAVGYFESLDLRDPGFGAAVVARGEEEGAEGPAALTARVRTWTTSLEEQLPSLPVDHRLAVLDGGAISLDAYVRTRLVELVVHHADLAVSLDVPEMPASAREEAIGVLVALSRRRHGDRAVVEALSRPQRAQGISYF